MAPYLNLNGSSESKTSSFDNSKNVSNTVEEDKSMPIAIVGMGFRGPADATSVENLWKMISEGREGRSEIPKDRWNNEAFYHPNSARNGTHNVEAGHFMTDDLSRFDAPFFSMNNTEVAALDPQQRLLLECTYEALENAGTPLCEILGTQTSVFVGSFCGDYTDMLLRDPDTVPMYQCTNSGHSRATLANRISYFFDLHGPSVTIDTACSASLVSLHLGCQSLRTGDAKRAIVAGANVILSHEIMIAMSMMRFMSPDGRCYTFDDRANGYARGEGVGSIILKPLADALRDGDTVRAVIRGTGSNQDGKTSGITLPNAYAQEALIRSTYKNSGLDPTETTYVEAHGTGTPAGDPLETGALSKVFCPTRSPEEPLKIGSIKTNVGHLEGASGIAGVIKTVLMLENKIILPNRNFQNANPRIPLYDWKLKVPTSVEPWDVKGPRRASVNSFGYGGSNAHAILEDAAGYLSARGLQAPYRTTQSLLPGKFLVPSDAVLNSSADSALGLTDISPTSDSVNDLSNGFTDSHSSSSADENRESSINTTPMSTEYKHDLNRDFVAQAVEGIDDTRSKAARLFVLTAVDEAAGKQQAKALANYLNQRVQQCDDCFLDDLAYTLDERRSSFNWKAAIPATSADDLIEKLNGDIVFSKSSKRPNIAFVFTGQGAQWCGMGRELLASYPLFRGTMKRIGAQLKSIGAPFDLIDEITRDPKSSQIGLALYSQPICTAVQIALVDLLHSWGITPTSVTGHSSGEIAAAYTFGALTWEDAVEVAYYRGVASSNMQKSGKVRGAMMAVGMAEEDIQPHISKLVRGKAKVACVNSPSSTTISGDVSAIDELQRILEETKVFARKLAVEVAYHSHHMDLVAGEYLASISKISPQRVREDVQFFSSVTGEKISSASDLGPDYWVANMVSQVRFADSLRQLCLGTSSGKRQRKRVAAPAVNTLIEIGPHGALAGPIRQTLQAEPKLKDGSVEYFSALVRKSNAVKTAVDLVSNLVVRGHQIAFPAINRPTELGSHNLLVDLPSYSWNHSESYWAEPRISTVFRNRKYPRTDLLGALDKNSKPLEPRWRNHIRTSEIPWVNDHRVQSNVVYPAAGYIAMAIEAAFQRATERSVTNITGYRLREISVGSALIIPEQSGEIEVSMTLKPYSDSMRSPSNIWDEFCVFSVTEDNSWTEHCRGLISVIAQQKSANIIDGDVQVAEKKRIHAHLIAETEEKCVKEVDVKQFYTHLTSLGLEYGATFANMIRARSARNSCVAEIVSPDTASVMPMNFQYSFILHPAMLDSMLHPIFVALSAEVGLLEDPVLPVFLGEVYVSQSIVSQPGDTLMTYTSVKKKDERYISASLLAVDKKAPDDGLVLTMTDLECTILARDKMEKSVQETNRMAHHFQWGPDVDFLSSAQTRDLCLKGESFIEEVNDSRDLEQVAFYYVEWALKIVANSELHIMHTHHQKLWNRMKVLVDQVREGKPGQQTSSWTTATQSEQVELRHRIRDSGAEGNLLCHMGRQLPAILRKEVEPSHLMMEKGHLGGHLEAYKKESPRYKRSFRALRSYLELLGHKNPHLSILEVGAEAGGALSSIIQALSGTEEEVARFERYTYTSVSNESFGDVEKRFASLRHLITCQTLDIEVDPLDQGFEAESYDVVIAVHVLNGTKSTLDTLNNVHKLLRPGGKLIFIEMTREHLSSTILFGTLPSWWIREKSTMSEQEWDSALLESGFSGLEVDVWDSSSELDHQSSMMVSTVPHKTIAAQPEVLIIAEERDCGVSLVRLLTLLSDMKLPAEISTFANAKPEGKVCIVLSELCGSYLYDPTPQQFDTSKDILIRADGVLWVVRGGVCAPSDPNGSLISGMARTARSENGGTTIVTLDLDKTPLADSAAANTVFSLFRSHFAFVQDRSRMLDVEYIERNGLLMVPRIVEDNVMNQTLKAIMSTPIPEDQPFHQLGRPLRMEVTPGFLDSIRFVDDDRFTQEISADDVEIEVKAVGLNFKDVMMGLGQILSEALGGEASGVVSRVGKSVHNLSVGDRVSCYGFGTFSNFYRGASSAFQKMPDTMSFELGAALPVTYCTAFYSVYHLARVSKEDSVLIHAATGGLGQAIIELCQLIGAEIFASVGTLEKKALLMDRFAIPEDHIFFSRDGSFASEIMRMTGGRGADVIMNSLAGEALRLTWNCIAPYGRFIELGARDLTVNSRLEMANFLKNPMFAAFNLVYLIRQKRAVADEVWVDVMRLFHQGSLKGPTPLHVHSVSEVEKALRIMQTGQHIGKLVAVAEPNVTVKAIPQNTSKRLLRADASYLIVGGLGGVGRATAGWMIEHGAKNLIFANRSGLARQDAKDAIQALQHQGANVTVYPCDVCDSAQLDNLIAQSSKSMPPIRGVIQSAMVLRDMLFETMTLEDYNAVMRPKVHGTWNLHRQLPKDMDFFLMLSSVSGIIGNATQAAYAAGSTFMDAFASYRTSLGLPATTLDLGVITGIGYLAENKELAEGMERQGFEGTNEERLMALIHSAIAEPCRQGPLSQIVTGLGTWKEGTSLSSFDLPPFAHFRRRGLESKGGNGGDSSDRIGDALRRTLTFEEATDRVCMALVDRISSRSSIPVDNINTSKAITEFGIDSLVAVELRNWIAREMDSTIPILDLLANQSLQQLSAKIAQKSRLVNVSTEKS
ncbi:hypothetical protein ACLMJK_007562 [Lecanora helva]